MTFALRMIHECAGCGRQGEHAEVKARWVNPYYRTERDERGIVHRQMVLCPKCARWHPRYWFKNKRIGRWSYFFYPDPGIGFCYRCNTTWHFVEGHTTMITDGSGVFPMCEACWVQTTAAQRLPYYRRLWELHESQGGAPEPWHVWQRAVMEERA